MRWDSSNHLVTLLWLVAASRTALAFGPSHARAFLPIRITTPVYDHSSRLALSKWIENNDPSLNARTSSQSPSTFNTTSEVGLLERNTPEELEHATVPGTPTPTDTSVDPTDSAVYPEIVDEAAVESSNDFLSDVDKASAVHIQSGRKELVYDQSRSRFFETGGTEELPLSTLFDRTLDTVEDAVLMARRLPFDYGLSVPKEQTQTVVVLGSGWAAHALLKVADTYKIRLICVSPTNHFVFTPMLASAAVGTVEYRSMTEAVRSANPMIESYVEGKAVDIDVQNKRLTIQLEDLLDSVRVGKASTIHLDYDKLIVAVGCRVNDQMVPGAAEYCLRLKTCEDARRLRVAIGESLEYASRPDVADAPNLAAPDKEARQQERRRRATFCIVGGGPTGVELAGELADFVKDCTKPRKGSYQRLKDDIRIILIQGADSLVPQFDRDLRDHALKTLQKQNIEVRLNTRVNEVGDGYIKLAEKGGGVEETINNGVTVWAAGTSPVPFIDTLLSKLPEEARAVGGRVKVDKWLRCPTPTADTFGSILVLGDAAAAERDDSFLPQTAQVAGQQGAYVARLFNRDYDLTQTPPVYYDDKEAIDKAWLNVRGLKEAPGFDFLNLGLLAYVGDKQALSQVQLGDFPIASYAGSISFVLWRSVYLVKQVATRNRVLVSFDWLKSNLFGRDITRL
jgi:NADH dehydrogenase FAD-containing subunit